MNIIPHKYQSCTMPFQCEPNEPENDLMPFCNLLQTLSTFLCLLPITHYSVSRPLTLLPTNDSVNSYNHRSKSEDELSSPQIAPFIKSPEVKRLNFMAIYFHNFLTASTCVGILFHNSKICTY